MKWFLFLILRLAFLVVATFGFIVLFQYGTSDFQKHAAEEYDYIVGLVKDRIGDSAPKE